MGRIRGTARTTGLIYLMMGLPAPFVLLYLPSRFVVKGDAAASAAQILDAELVYRMGMLASLIASVGFLLLVQSLYTLLKDVDRQQARMMVMFVLIAVALAFVDMILLAAPLTVLKNPEALSAFTAAQRDALAYEFLRLRTSEMNIAASLWGLWLFPFGVLVWKSGFIPRLIGLLLIVGGIAYLVGSLTFMLFPEYFPLVTRFTLPLGAPGELSIMLWLLIRGHKVLMPSQPLAVLTAERA